MYLFLHTVKGTPFETPDQGKARLLTHWEQMDYGIQFTASRKFLTISPIVLYVCTAHLLTKARLGKRRNIAITNYEGGKIVLWENLAVLMYTYFLKIKSHNLTRIRFYLVLR